jgi:hypothetical protein
MTTCLNLSESQSLTLAKSGDVPYSLFADRTHGHAVAIHLD